MVKQEHIDACEYIGKQVLIEFFLDDSDHRAAFRGEIRGFRCVAPDEEGQSDEIEHLIVFDDLCIMCH